MSDLTPSERSSDAEAPGDRPATLGPDAPAPPSAATAEPQVRPSPPPATPPSPPVPPPSPPAVPLGNQAGGDDSSPIARLTALADERPEMAVGGAFAGGLVLALILKRLAR